MTFLFLLREIYCLAIIQNARFGWHPISQTMFWRHLRRDYNLCILFGIYTCRCRIGDHAFYYANDCDDNFKEAKQHFLTLAHVTRTRLSDRDEYDPISSILTKRC